MSIKKIILCLIGNHGYSLLTQFHRMSDETRLSLSHFIIRPVICYILYFICSTLTSMSFIYFVISILDFIIEIRIICLRIFLLNTINISMFSLYTWTTYLSSRAANNHQVFFFFSYFSLLSSQEVIYILLLDGLELTQLTTNTIVNLCVSTKL